MLLKKEEIDVIFVKKHPYEVENIKKIQFSRRKKTHN